MKNGLKCLLLASVAGILLSGCVVTNQILERQGTKALLKKDYDTAAARFKEAADDGSAKAQYYLGTMYLEGQGVEADPARTVKLLEQASAQEQQDALLMLGLFYVNGDFVQQDQAKGAELIRRAALQGNDVAMFYMGNLYASGLGVDKDTNAALEWLHKAEAAGFPVKDELMTEEGLQTLYN